MELKDKMDYIKKCVEHLDSLVENYGPEQIVHSFLLLTSTLYTLQTAIQSLIDMGLRFLAELGVKPPQQYSDVGRMLHEADVLSSSDMEVFRRMVGFRNILVHRYLGVDIKLLREILEKRMYHDVARIALKILEEAEGRGLDP